MGKERVVVNLVREIYIRHLYHILPYTLIMWEGKFLITIDEILSFALDRRLDMLPFQGSNVAVAAKPPVR